MKFDFSKLSVKNIYALIDLLLSVETEDINYLNKRFVEVAFEFDATLEFLQIFGLINYSQQKVIRSKNFQSSKLKALSKIEFRQYLGEKIISSNNPISLDIQKYLAQFTVKGNSLIYKPISKQRRYESGIRNFLIELGIIEYLDAQNLYFITDEYVNIFSKNTTTIYQTPKELDFLLEKQKELGKAAEKSILEYEKDRLSKRPDLQTKILHVAEHNTRAGYDIRSFETDSPEDSPIARFIEVKAVSIIDYHFFWSRNEIKVAQELGEKYFIYLLPVIKENSFDTHRLEIIQDPYKDIFLDNPKWLKQEELFSFRQT